MRRQKYLFIYLLGCIGLFSSPAFAGSHVKSTALVEDVNAPSTKIEIMDFLPEGLQIPLKNNETITISYLSSCIVETIKAGHIQIGSEQSRVSGGKVNRETVACDGQQVETAQLFVEAGGYAIQSVKTNTLNESNATTFAITGDLQDFSNTGKTSKEISLEIHNIYPVILYNGTATHLDLIDLSDTTQQSLKLNQGRISMKELGIPLQKGHKYKLNDGKTARFFHLATDATDEDMPLISHLITM